MSLSISISEILVEEFMKPMQLTPKMLAERSGISVKDIEDLISGKSPMTNKMAIDLSNAFDTSVEFWMNLESSVSRIKNMSTETNEQLFKRIEEH